MTNEQIINLVTKICDEIEYKYNNENFAPYETISQMVESKLRDELEKENKETNFVSKDIV